jgi:hypothetical protein
MISFTPVKDFVCEELQSCYCAGLSYTLKDYKDPSIAGDDKRSVLTRENRKRLAKLLPQWLKEGKVVLGVQAAQHGIARLEGQGDVVGEG